MLLGKNIIISWCVKFYRFVTHFIRVIPMHVHKPVLLVQLVPHYSTDFRVMRSTPWAYIFVHVYMVTHKRTNIWRYVWQHADTIHVWMLLYMFLFYLITYMSVCIWLYAWWMSRCRLEKAQAWVRFEPWPGGVKRSVPTIYMCEGGMHGINTYSYNRFF